MADSGNDCVLEVTPDGQVVWEYEISRGPYDIERVRYGDEPQGPPMHEIEGSASVRSAETDESGSLVGLLEGYRELASWVLPPGAGIVGFVGLHGAVLTGVVWARYEWAARE